MIATAPTRISQGSARVSRAGEAVSGSRTFRKIVSARRQNQNARRAHNPSGARVLAETWREQFGNERATIILAVLRDKDHRGICETLAPIGAYVVLPKISGQRAAEPETLAQVFSTITPTLQHSIAASIAHAFELARARPNPILLTGSLHFAGEALAALGGDMAAFEECAQ